MSIRCTAVVGLGVIGASWVAQFLGAGLRVRCFDPAPEAAAALPSFLAEALGEAPAWQARLHVAQDLPDALQGVDLVQENGPEAPPLKRALIEAIDAILTHGLALRWASAGPFALTELGGGAGGGPAMLARLGPALHGWWDDLSRLAFDGAARDAVLAAMAQHPPQPRSADEMHRLGQEARRYQAFCATAER